MVTDRRGIFPIIARGLSAVLLLPITILIILALITPLTLSGLLYVVGFVALMMGIVGVAWGYRRLRYVLWLGLGLIVTVAAVRIILLGNPNKIKLLILPEQNAPCLLNCLVDEQDASLVSTRLLPLIGWISPTEADGLLEAMYSGYQGMAADQSLVASPFARTYLNLQHPGAFDAVIIEPQDNQPVQMGMIFLHGFIGNFTMPCWLVAQAVRTNHAVTVCPSVDWKGDWWTSNGETTLRATIDYLHKRGVTRIYLAGLSNGGVGASELAYKLTADIAGLILISGASPDAQDSGLPVLVLSGRLDERMPTDMLRAYANRLGDKVTFIAFDSDHFMLAKKSQEIQAAIESWLQQH
jgi:pimeloyl-ACP methyl ester carboxylesterase